MKKIIILGFILLSVLSSKAQYIIPVEDAVNYINSEKGLIGDKTRVYVKDVNNVLDKYVGRWKGTYNGKTYSFIVEKHTKDYEDLYEDLKLKEDLLLIRYKITDTKGKIIDDITMLPDNNTYVIEGLYLSKQGSYVLNYAGKKCGQSGDIFMNIPRLLAPNRLRLYLMPSVEIGCDNPQPQIMPTNKDPDFILKKQ